MNPNIEKSPKKWRCLQCSKKLPWNDCVTVQSELTDKLLPGFCPRAYHDPGACSGQGKRARLPDGVNCEDIDSPWYYGKHSECSHQCSECSHLLKNYATEGIASRTYTGDRLPGYLGTFCGKGCATDYALKVVHQSYGLPTLDDMPKTEHEKRHGYTSHRLPWLIQREE